MKMHIRLHYLPIMILVFGGVLLACKQEAEIPNILPTLTITQAQPEDITRTSVILAGTVSKNMREAHIQQVGFQCCTNSTFTENGDLRTIPLDDVSENTLNDSRLKQSGYVLSFSGQISDLLPNTKYWVRAYATSNTKFSEWATAYSESIVFTTPATSAPSFKYVTIGNPLPTSVPISVTISDMGSELLTYDDVTMSGYIYKRITNAAEASNLRTNTSGVKTVLKFPDKEGRLDTVLTDLVPGATYAVRAFAVAEGTGYGVIKTFETKTTSLPAVSVARNTGSQSVGQVSLSADVIAAGSTNITARGFVYSRTETMPQIVGSTLVSCPLDASETFSATISNLSVGVTYYIRAYATNNAGTGYSSEALQVSIAGEIKAPTVSLISVSLTTSQDETSANMAEMVGFLASNGGGALEEIGFELSESENMEGAKKFYGDLEADNMFRAISYQLAGGTTYYIRAFAQNSAGTAYSDVKTVTTPYSQYSVPSVVTVQPEDISTTFAVLGGYVRNEGGSQIRAVGFQVSKSQDMSDPIVVDANANDQLEFMREIHNLEPNTTYYVRAFAENSTGMGYGNIRTFTTSQANPTNNERTFTVTGNGKTVTFKMIKVEGGTFQMGSTTGDSDEQPVHSVTISKAYYMCETEVTQALWYAVMGQSPTSVGSSWSSSYGIGDNYPAYYISYEDCQSFLTALNSKLSSQLGSGEQFRFPTEAEWEFAAKGGNKSKGYTYAGSNTIDDVAWYNNNSSSSTHQIKIKAANELGLYDMSGNVWEWCEDWYGSYSTGAQTDPTGAASGSYRVNRGGSWGYNARGCRVSRRGHDTPVRRSGFLGLRLAQ